MNFIKIFHYKGRCSLHQNNWFGPVLTEKSFRLVRIKDFRVGRFLVGLLLILNTAGNDYFRSPTQKKFENTAPTRMNDEGLADDDDGDDVCVSSSLPSLKLKPALTSASHSTVNRAKRSPSPHIICWRQAASVFSASI